MVFYYEGRSIDKYGIGIVHVTRQLNMSEQHVLDTNAENNCLKLPQMSMEHRNTGVEKINNI